MTEVNLNSLDDLIRELTETKELVGNCDVRIKIWNPPTKEGSPSHGIAAGISGWLFYPEIKTVELIGCLDEDHHKFCHRIFQEYKPQLEHLLKREKE
jgi:hypothetical protein